MTENLNTELKNELQSVLDRMDSFTTKEMVAAIEAIYEKAMVADYLSQRDQNRENLQKRVLKTIQNADSAPIEFPEEDSDSTQNIAEETINLTPEIKVVPAPDGPPPMPRELEEDNETVEPQAPAPAADESVEEPKVGPEPVIAKKEQHEAPVAKETVKQAQPKAPRSIAEQAQEQNKRKSLHTQLAAKALKFGLNDRLAYVKHLFEGNADDFNRVISQINTLETWDEANDFIENMIKPDYNWNSKAEFEERFVSQIKTKFE